VWRRRAGEVNEGTRPVPPAIVRASITSRVAASGRVFPRTTTRTDWKRRRIPWMRRACWRPDRRTAQSGAACGIARRHRTV